MFQNSLQSNSFFSILDPNNQQNSQASSKVYRLENMHRNFRILDKDVKSNVFTFMKKNATISFPSDPNQDLALKQSFLHIQIYLFAEMNWKISLQVSDQNKIKRRFLFSSSISEFEKKLFAVKYPCKSIQGNSWLHLTIDLNSFCKCFKGVEFARIDKIEISGFLKLRRIFTTQQLLQSNVKSSNEFVPLKFLYPQSIKHSYFELSYEPLKIQTNTNVHKYLQIQRQNRSNQIRSAMLPRNKNQCRVDRGSKTKINQYDNLKLPKLRNGNKQNNDQNSPYTKPIVYSSQSQRLSLKNQRYSCNKNNEIIVSARMGLKSHQVTESSEQQCSIESVTFMQNVNSQKSRQVNGQVCREGQFLQNENDNQNIRLKYVRFSSLRSSEIGSLKNSNKNMASANQQEIEQELEFEQSFTCKDSPEMQNNKANLVQNISPSSESKTKSYETSTNADIDIEQSKIRATHFLKQNSYQGFGEKVLQKYMDQIQRPYSPPLLTERDDESLIQNVITPKIEKNKLNLIYDPILECYFDCKSHSYYTLKN